MVYPWDFSKLPDSEHDRVVEAFNWHDYATLLIIHDQYELSKNDYGCCVNTNEGIYANFKLYVEETNIS